MITKYEYSGSYNFVKGALGAVSVHPSQGALTAIYERDDHGNELLIYKQGSTTLETSFFDGKYEYAKRGQATNLSVYPASESAGHPEYGLLLSPKASLIFYGKASPAQESGKAPITLRFGHGAGNTPVVLTPSGATAHAGTPLAQSWKFSDASPFPKEVDYQERNAFGVSTAVWHLQGKSSASGSLSKNSAGMDGMSAVVFNGDDGYGPLPKGQDPSAFYQKQKTMWAKVSPHMRATTPPKSGSGLMVGVGVGAGIIIIAGAIFFLVKGKMIFR